MYLTQAHHLGFELQYYLRKIVFQQHCRDGTKLQSLTDDTGIGLITGLKICGGTDKNSFASSLHKSFHVA